MRMAWSILMSAIQGRKSTGLPQVQHGRVTHARRLEKTEQEFIGHPVQRQIHYLPMSSALFGQCLFVAATSSKAISPEPESVSWPRQCRLIAVFGLQFRGRTSLAKVHEDLLKQA